MEFLNSLLSFAATLGMLYGAYQGIQRMRENGTWSGAAYGLTVVVQLIYVLGGVSIILAYSLMFAWDFFGAFLIGTGLYLTIGFYVCWKLVAFIKERFPPKAGGPKPSVVE